MKFLSTVFKRVVLVAILIAAGFNAMAVTDAEMDQAKAIAAKFYIRYINNGAGYLDNWLPKSMADLEKKLTNNTDRQNLKNFKQVATPTDYSSWSKDKLVAYWSNTFFNDNASSLDSKAASNAMCKKQIKTAVSRLEIAPPAPATPAPAAEEAPAQTPDAEAAATPEATDAAEEEIARELAEVDGEMQEAQDMVDQEAAAPAESGSSGTWVYIMILAILVAVVIFLVVYASRTMKGQDGKTKAPDDAPELEEEYALPPSRSLPEPEPIRPSVADDTRIREKYAATLASKAEEIRTLTRQLAEMESLAAGLKEENRRLTAEVEQLRNYSAAAQPATHSRAQHHDRHPRRESDYAPRQGYGSPHGSSHNANHGANHSANHGAENPEVREIYLGRVNSKGLFVRADRHAVDGQSIYKLTTTNGQSGSYTLIHNPLIEEQVLEDPGKWLAGGCFAKDIFDTEGRQGICTETPGTAVFRDGAWRVERKAKIRYC